MRDHQDKLNWLYISNSQKLSESFILEFEDKVDWSEISIYQQMSEDFIRNHQDKIVWESLYQHFSKKFKEEFKHKF